MDIKGININDVNMMSNNRQVRDNPSNKVKDDANNTTDSVVDNSSVEEEGFIQLTPNIKMKKAISPTGNFIAITLEEIRDGKKYTSIIDIQPSKGRVSVYTLGPKEGGEYGLLRSYEISKDMIMNSFHGFTSTLPREVIDLLFLLKDNGVDFGKVNIEEIANRKPNKIYDLAHREGGIRLYRIIGGIIGAGIFGAIAASIYGAIGASFGPIPTVLYAILGGLMGINVGSFLEIDEYVKFASNSNRSDIGSYAIIAGIIGASILGVIAVASGSTVASLLAVGGGLTGLAWASKVLKSKEYIGFLSKLKSKLKNIEKNENKEL